MARRRGGETSHSLTYVSELAQRIDFVVQNVVTVCSAVYQIERGDHAKGSDAYTTNRPRSTHTHTHTNSRRTKRHQRNGEQEAGKPGWSMKERRRKGEGQSLLPTVRIHLLGELERVGVSEVHSGRG